MSVRFGGYYLASFTPDTRLTVATNKSVQALFAQRFGVPNAMDVWVNRLEPKNAEGVGDSNSYVVTVPDQYDQGKTMRGYQLRRTGIPGLVRIQKLHFNA